MELERNPRIKASRVSKRLFDLILDGRLEPGTYLREREVAAEFKVSRTPVREALRQLARDGYVRLIPRVGAQVNELSLQDLFDVFDVRRCLEPFAARLAAERLTPEARAELRQIRKVFKKEMTGQPSAEVLQRHMAADRRLHQLSLELSGNRRITQVVSHMTELTLLTNRRLGTDQRIRKSAQEHLEIVEALLRSDAAAAEVAMARHLLQAMEDIRDIILSGLGPRGKTIPIGSVTSGQETARRGSVPKNDATRRDVIKTKGIAGASTLMGTRNVRPAAQPPPASTRRCPRRTGG